MSGRIADAKALYQAGYAISKIAELLHVSPSTVHAWVHKDGDYRDKPWVAAEDFVLRVAYESAGDEAPDITQISKTLGRSRAAVACRANALGLPNRSARPRRVTREQISSTVKLSLAFRGHPRGMLGKSHTDEAKAKISRANIGRTHTVPLAQRKKQSARMTERLSAMSAGAIYSRAARGRRPDLGDAFFRSAWEANVARWLNFHGRRWEYEPKTFWFERIRRGVRSYTPDFYLPDEDLFIEVKGWMDPKSRTKLKRMAKYYPSVQIEVIDAKRYRELESYASVIPGWERKKAEAA